jgi:hypothetical protein
MLISLSLEETLPRDPRYQTIRGPGCMGLIHAGETRYCTLYNDDKPATSTSLVISNYHRKDKLDW